MKKISLILISLLTLTALFTTSCKKEIENADNSTVHVKESATVKSVISSLRSGPGQSNNGTASQVQVNNAIDAYFCFDFVYPISVVYNDGSVQSLADDNELSLAIVSQTDIYYIIDFVYPFDISQNGTTITINNEDDFTSAINSCLSFTNFCLMQTTCFDFVYPISLEMTDGSVVTVNNQQEFDSLFTAASFPVDIVYPFEVSQNGTNQTISNAVEFQVLLDSCYGNSVYFSSLPPSSTFSSYFSLVYPVTLVYNDGTTLVVNNDTEYDDAMYGSTSSHYVVDFQYDIEITINGVNGTIHNAEEFFDQIVYFITGHSGFAAGAGYSPLPSTSVFANCFTINYPITFVYSDGSTQILANDAEYDQYLEGSTMSLYVIDFEYPFTVTQNGNPITVNSLLDFETLIGDCVNN